MANEAYAVRVNADGTKTRYKTRRDYEAARFQASGIAAAVRANINKKVGGKIV